MKLGIYQDIITPYREQLFQKISEHGLEVHMIIGGPPVKRPYWTKDGILEQSNSFKKIFLHSTKFNFGGYAEYFSPSVLSVLLKQRYDIMVIPFGMLAGPLLLSSAKCAGSLTVSGTGVSFFSRTVKRIAGEPIVRLCTLLSDNFLAYSEYAKRYLMREGAGSSRIVIIPNGVDTQKFTPKMEETNLKQELGLAKKRIVLFAGQLETEKGVQYLIKAMAIVKNHERNAHLLIVGSGSLETHLKNLVSQLGLRKHVTFIGPVNSQKMPQYYAMCDIHAASSIVTKTFIEPFGMVYVEAMASGKPSVAFDIPAAVREIIVDGETGYLVPEKNIEALAEKIAELLRDEEKRMNMGKKARERAVAHYDMNRIAEKWIEAFQFFESQKEDISRE
jgi:glycosyltransferase involved in cell wall biosynthesis